MGYYLVASLVQAVGADVFECEMRVNRIASDVGYSLFASLLAGAVRFLHFAIPTMRLNGSQVRFNRTDRQIGNQTGRTSEKEKERTISFSIILDSLGDRVRLDRITRDMGFSPCSSLSRSAQK